MRADESKFDDVQKALALKRHEQPPPKFFNRFSDEVIGKIHRPDPPRPMPWYERLGWGEDGRPFWLCGLGVVVCAVLVLTLIAALRVDKPEGGLAPKVQDPSQVVTAPGSGSAPETLPGYPSLSNNGTAQGGLAPVLAPEGGANALVIKTQRVEIQP